MFNHRPMLPFLITSLLFSCASTKQETKEPFVNDNGWGTVAGINGKFLDWSYFKVVTPSLNCSFAQDKNETYINTPSLCFSLVDASEVSLQAKVYDEQLTTLASDVNKTYSNGSKVTSSLDGLSFTFGGGDINTSGDQTSQLDAFETFVAYQACGYALEGSVIPNVIKDGYFSYIDDGNGGLSLFTYAGRSDDVYVPSEINGKSVTSLSAYSLCLNETCNLHLPKSLINVEANSINANKVHIYFEGETLPQGFADNWYKQGKMNSGEDRVTLTLGSY
jgi:hypothetical protein